MNQRLVYIIGPSGAGKDSVLQGLRAAWGTAADAHWARRTITRPAAENGEGEQHEAVDAPTFEALRRSGAFAMHWQANGLAYGIRQAEVAPVHAGRWVFVNGSRAWLPQLLQDWPEAIVVHIGAATEVLAQRLAARGRETAQDIAARLERQVPLALPPGSIRIENNGALADAVCALQNALQARDRGSA